jgi:hypothetical protein
MIISHAKKFVLLLPWKTASSTQIVRLAPYNESPYSLFYDYNIHLQRVVHRHLTCADFAALPESRLGYLVASFVRNPYDRVYSGFLQIRRDIAEQPSARFPTQYVRDLVIRQLEANLAQLSAADFDFDKWMESLRDFQVYEIGHNSSLPLHPAHYWTHLAGQQIAGFIGKVESFEDDFSNLCSMIGIEKPENLKRNVSELGNGETGHNSGYRHLQRMCRRSIDKINDLFRKDFELFHYDIVH